MPMSILFLSSCYDNFIKSETCAWRMWQTHLYVWKRRISMVLCKTAVTPLLTHWSYCSLALSYRYMFFLQAGPVKSRSVLNNIGRCHAWTAIPHSMTISSHRFANNTITNQHIRIVIPNPFLHPHWTATPHCLMIISHINRTVYRLGILRRGQGAVLI